MVYVDPKNLGYNPYWQRWVNTRNPVEQGDLNLLFEKYVPPLIKLILEGIMNDVQGHKLKLIVPMTNLNMVTQLSYTLQAMLPEKTGGDMEMFFLVAIYWSLGAGLLEESRETFDGYVRELSGLAQIEDQGKVTAKIGEMPIHHGRLYEYMWKEDLKEWVPWKFLVPAYEYNPTLKFSQILVPTVDTEKITWILKLMDKVRRPTVLIGEMGTSKTATTQNYVNNLDQDLCLVINMNFSSRTSSLDVQRYIESSVEKRTKDVYGPPPGKRILVFIDDMNMPQVDTYGTQQPIALLKLLMDKGGMYDRGKDLNWKQIKDICEFLETD
jgi:dynein heavy chain